MNENRYTRRQTVKLVGGGVVGASWVASQKALADDHVGAEKAQNKGTLASKYLNWLQTLEERPEVDIDDDDLKTISQHIEAGDEEYKVGKYEGAHDSYTTAVEQAIPTLKAGYREGATTLLDGCTTYLERLYERDYNTPRMGVLEDRITKQRRRLQSAVSLGDLREVYKQIRNDLWEDVQSLPDPKLVDAVDTASSPAVWGTTGVAVAGATAGGYWLMKHRSSGGGGANKY